MVWKWNTLCIYLTRSHRNSSDDFLSWLDWHIAWIQSSGQWKKTYSTVIGSDYSFRMMLTHLTTSFLCMNFILHLFICYQQNMEEDLPWSEAAQWKNVYKVCSFVLLGGSSSFLQRNCDCFTLLGNGYALTLFLDEIKCNWMRDKFH